MDGQRTVNDDGGMDGDGWTEDGRRRREGSTGRTDGQMMTTATTGRTRRDISDGTDGRTDVICNYIYKCIFLFIYWAHGPQSSRVHGALHGCAGGARDADKSYLEVNNSFPSNNSYYRTKKT